MGFAVGDVVWLKSGGARMTVAAVDAAGQCRCVWHASEARGIEERSSLYAAAMLTATDPGQASPSRPTSLVPDPPGEYKVYEEGDD